MNIITLEECCKEMKCVMCGKSISKDILYINRVFDNKDDYFCSDECLIEKIFSLPSRMADVFDKILPNLPTLDLVDAYKMIGEELKSNRKIVKF